MSHDLRHGYWAWSSLFLHTAGRGDSDFTDDDHFRLVLELIERAPWDNGVLWMIGDGPLAQAVGDDVRYVRVEEMRRTDDKLDLVCRLVDLDWPDATP